MAIVLLKLLNLLKVQTDNNPLQFTKTRRVHNWTILDQLGILIIFILNIILRFMYLGTNLHAHNHSLEK